MTPKSFKAFNWIMSDSITDGDSQTYYSGKNDRLQSFTPPKTNNESQLFGQAFNPNQFFVPGWQGESLVSKDVKVFKKLLKVFHRDTKENFLKLKQANRKFKSLLFNEFVGFVEFTSSYCQKIQDERAFWEELFNDDSEFREILDQFIQVYTFKVSVLYILKMRLISHICIQTNKHFVEHFGFFPSSFITSVFVKGTSTELKTKCLESNIYSWYKPSKTMGSNILELNQVLETIQITEIIKNQALTLEALSGFKSEYSHSISHKSFGLFLNNLLINLPIWLEQNSEVSTGKQLSSDINVISCKYSGEYLESLSLSHWLAQYQNQKIKWDHILCPHFKEDHFFAGDYFKIVQELQFLVLLTDISRSQGNDCIQFLCNIVNRNTYNRKVSDNHQPSLLFDNLNAIHSSYDRIIVNLSHAPQNNGQHYVFNQLKGQLKTLKSDGYIYVLSSKRLFIQSQRDKVEALLQDLSLETIFNLESLKGKGEISNFIYVFSNKTTKQSVSLDKKACYHFRLSGELDTFSEFSEFTIQLQSFFESNRFDSVSMYQKETPSKLSFEFYQDAIINGQLIHSSSKDSSKITHPRFFNNLMNKCAPFDYFFDIRAVDFDEQNENEPTLFQFANFTNTLSKKIVIVDKRDGFNTKIELVDENILEAKAYQYGHAQCFYYQLTPKWHNLEFSNFEIFFKSMLGQQIIDLSFYNDRKKIKSQLSKLLIPKFLVAKKQAPNHIFQNIELLNISEQELLNLHPNQLSKNYKVLKMLIPEIAAEYPAQTLSQLSKFAMKVDKCLNFVSASKSQGINFNNPIIKDPLTLTKTHPIYPTNPDMHIQFGEDGKANSMTKIHSKLSACRVKKKMESGIQMHLVQLISDDHVIVEIYSEEEMVSFIKYLLSNLIGYPISSILQGLSVPRLSDLTSILSSYKSIRENFQIVHDSIDQLLESVINQSLTKE